MKDKSIILNTVKDLKDRAEQHQASLATYRDQNLAYYYGTKPAPPEDERSSHVSMDVMDSVESVKARMLEMLTADQRLVKFEPRTVEDDDTARLATMYTNDMIMRRNDGYSILHDAIWDGLMMRVGAVRVDWEEDTVTEEERHQAVPDEIIQILTDQGWTVQESEPVEGLMPGLNLFNVTVTRDKPANKVLISNIQPERFYVLEDPADNGKPDFLCEKCSIPYGDLIEAGYKPADVELLEMYDYADIESARVHQGDDSTDNWTQEDLKSRQERMVFKAYLRADFDRTNKMRWYEVLFGDSVILDVQQVDDHPFVYWSSLRIPHRTLGKSLADYIVSIQSAKTALRRAVLDVTVEAAMRRTVYNEHLIANTAEIMDRSNGGLIGVSDIHNALMELPPAQLPQGSMLAYETLEQEKEARSGYSRVAQGMNPDVVSKQNHRDTIAEYSKAGSTRVAQTTRLFAESFLKPMMRKVFSLGVKHENAEVMLRTDAETFTANPSAWYNADMDLKVAVALTSDELAAEAMQLLSLHQIMTADPKMELLYTDKHRADLIGRVAENLKINKHLVISDVESQEYQMAKQQQTKMQEMITQMQLQQAQFQQQMAQMQLQMQQMMADRDWQIKQAELALRAQDQKADHGHADDKIDLDRKRLLLDAEKSAVEISLETQQQRPVAID